MGLLLLLPLLVFEIFFNKKCSHEVVGVDGYGGVEVVFVFEGKQTLIYS